MSRLDTIALDQVLVDDVDTTTIEASRTESSLVVVAHSPAPALRATPLPQARERILTLRLG
jgi:hypothetical protein